MEAKRKTITAIALGWLVVLIVIVGIVRAPFVSRQDFLHRAGVATLFWALALVDLFALGKFIGSATEFVTKRGLAAIWLWGFFKLFALGLISLVLFRFASKELGLEIFLGLSSLVVIALAGGIVWRS